MEIKPLQTYKHSKTGNLYKIICIANNSETLEDMVVYEAQYENEISKLWVRPLNMFLEIVEINGEELPRFQLINK